MSQEFLKDNIDGKNHEGPNANWPVKYLTATAIIGDDVLNSDGDKIAEIKDIMVNIRRGFIEYVVIETNDFFGMKSRLFAIPFEELKLKASKKAFILEHKDEIIKNAPGFDKDHWPETNSHHYSSVDSYWGDFMGVHTGG